jgi:dTDP-4-amino-4,6-dideoxygalactose transaminase
MVNETKIEKKENSSDVTHVPLLDLKAQYSALRSNIELAIRDVVEAQYFILGPKVKELESKIAEYSHTKYAVGVSSGTDALLIALMALDIQPDDEVITTPYTFFATAGVISRLGAHPIFVDIENDTFNIDPHKIEQAITKKTKAILPVHLFGQMAEMNTMKQIADKYHLKIIEDAAQAIGAENDKGEKAGSLGSMGCFSFFPSKNLGAFGDAGMVVTNDDLLAEKLYQLRVHGSEPKYYHKIIGGNFRIDAIQAAILTIKLEYLDNWTKKRQENAIEYINMFQNFELDKKIGLPIIKSGYRHIFNQFVLRVPQRDKLLEHLRMKNIGCEIYYPVSLNNQECFSYLNYNKGDFPVSEKAAEETLAIPIYPELTLQQKQYVVSSINEFYQ